MKANERHKKTPLCYTCCSTTNKKRDKDTTKAIYLKIDSRRLIKRWKKEGNSSVVQSNNVVGKSSLSKIGSITILKNAWATNRLENFFLLAN